MATSERHNVKSSPYLELQNPFTAWEAAKMILLFPLALIRGVLLIAVLFVFALVSAVAIAGADQKAPLRSWRRAIVDKARLLGKLVMILLGFWVRVDGWDNYRHAQRSSVDLLVFNHPSWVDSILLMYLFAPSGVSREANLHIPVVGTIIRSFQNIYTPAAPKPQQHGSDPSSTPLLPATTTEQIAQRLSEPGWPMIAIAPEGMTSNNRYVLRFRTGAFVHGAPVLPVCIKYHWRRLNPSWTLRSEPWYLLRMLCQFVNVVSVRILPAYVPTSAECQDAELFAEGVRLTMAEALRVPTVPMGIRENRQLMKLGVTIDWLGRLSAPPGVIGDDDFVLLSPPPPVPAVAAESKSAPRNDGDEPCVSFFRPEMPAGAPAEVAGDDEEAAPPSEGDSCDGNSITFTLPAIPAALVEAGIAAEPASAAVADEGEQAPVTAREAAAGWSAV